MPACMYERTLNFLYMQVAATVRYIQADNKRKQILHANIRLLRFDKTLYMWHGYIKDDSIKVCLFVCE